MLLKLLLVSALLPMSHGFHIARHHALTRHRPSTALPAAEAELVPDDEDDDEEDWVPDRVKAKARREGSRIYAEKVKAAPKKEEEPTTAKPSAYTDDEEQIIASMGGKTMHPQRTREPGYLGDCTLSEIAMDYSIPVCYLADVLCMWGVPVPINVNDRLGDLVTGEQAFAILEAVNSLDAGALHDRYSNSNLLQVCDEYEVDVQRAFEMAMKEGWSLPFGVNTCLRVEQEEELLRVLRSDLF